MILELTKEQVDLLTKVLIINIKQLEQLLFTYEVEEMYKKEKELLEYLQTHYAGFENFENQNTQPLPPDEPVEATKEDKNITDEMCNFFQESIELHEQWMKGYSKPHATPEDEAYYKGKLQALAHMLYKMKAFIPQDLLTEDLNSFIIRWGNPENRHGKEFIQ